MRTISDYIRKEFAALGYPAIREHILQDGRQRLTFEDGTRIHAGAFASDNEIQQAARRAFMTDQAGEPAAPAVADPTPTATADVLPPVTVGPARPRDGAKLGGVMAKGYKPGSLKSLLDGLHKEGQSLMEEIQQEIAGVKEAYGKVRDVKQQLRAHSEQVVSELGQFTYFAEDEYLYREAVEHGG
jgi:hypothetical protein